MPTTQDTPDVIYQRVAKLAVFCMVIYIAIYTFESPIRYILAMVGGSQLILARDALIILPLGALIILDAFNQKTQPIMIVTLAIMPVAVVVGIVNFGSYAPVALGFKMFLNVILGMMVGLSLIDPSPRLFRLFVAFWAITLIGVVLEKYVVNYPWVGMHAIIGNQDVEISRDWQVTDAFNKRVGGFTRVSISAAGLMPLLCCVAISSIRSEILRHLMIAVTVAAVFMTTQKGALLGMIVVWITMMTPIAWRVSIQGAVALLSVVSEILAPMLTGWMHIPQGIGGSYSSASFIQRIVTTWPDTFTWIERKQIFPFGVGLGGVGEAQRFVSTIAFHYPDNMFLFLLCTFGVSAILLFLCLAWAAYRGMMYPSLRMICALSVFTFILVYGTFVSIIEDQMEALFLGASLGALFSVKEAARDRNLVSVRAPGRRTRPPPVTGPVV